ncbi:MAG: phosphotransferase family protein [Chloroflexi bacterium]|nr:phosphotransferase family protein [Chloroflexota bacterium]
MRQFGGGAANLTYLLDYKTHQYVLRRPPLGPVAKSAHDMAREYKVLSVLHEVFPYAPQALLYCDETAVIGTNFLVMARQQGLVVRRAIPEAYAGTADAPQRMSEALVDTLAQFHAVDYEAIGLADLGSHLVLSNGRSKAGIGGGARRKRMICRRWMQFTAGSKPISLKPPNSPSSTMIISWTM